MPCDQRSLRAWAKHYLRLHAPGALRDRWLGYGPNPWSSAASYLHQHPPSTPNSTPETQAPGVPQLSSNNSEPKSQQRSPAQLQQRSSAGAPAVDANPEPSLPPPAPP